MKESNAIKKEIRKKNLLEKKNIIKRKEKGKLFVYRVIVVS